MRDAALLREYMQEKYNDPDKFPLFEGKCSECSNLCASLSDQKFWCSDCVDKHIRTNDPANYRRMKQGLTWQTS